VDLFESIQQSESNGIHIEFGFSGTSANPVPAVSACLLVTKLTLLALCDKSKQFTNILIHVLLNNYVTFYF